MENFFRYVRLTEGEGGEEVEVTAFLLLSSPHSFFIRRFDLHVCFFAESLLVFFYSRAVLLFCFYSF